MAIVTTDKRNIEAHTIQTYAYYGFWISVEFSLDDGDDAPWTKEAIYAEASGRLGP